MNLVEKKFYNLYWKDKTCQNIFSVHKTELLENEVHLTFSKEKFLAQRFVLSNSLKRDSGNMLATRNINEGIEIVHNLQEKAKEYFDEDKMSIFFDKKFGLTASKIEKDIHSKGLFSFGVKILGVINNEKRFLKLLHEYSIVPKKFNDLIELGDYVEKQLKLEFEKFIKSQNLSDLALSIDLLSTYYNNKTKDDLSNSITHYSDTLYDVDNYKDRMQIFDELYDSGVFVGGKLKSYYECVKCDPGVFSGIMSLNVSPKKLKLKCPRCGKETLYIVPYEIEKNIYNAITHKDGLLFSAIQFLLNKKKYAFYSNKTFLKDIEIDFCLYSSKGAISEMVEVKMFKTARPFDTKVGNIRQTVGQIKKNVDKLSKKGIIDAHVKQSIVVNFDDDKVFKEAKKELKTDLKNYNIKIYSISKFGNYLNESQS